jgi:TolB protein
MTFFNNNPQVYLFNLETGQQSIIGNFPGMSFAPVFSPDGNQLIMSIARKGNTDIYEMDLMTRELERLTRNSGIDTSPSFSPDGEQVAFVSDRSGRPQIYTMDRDGSNARRISFGEGRYGDPMWSPRGDYIAFIKILRGEFYLGVMYTDGSGERLLTKAFNLESPSWSPNGRRLIYYKQELIGNTDETRVYSIDITGYNERELYTPTEASDPSWSPLLQ